MTPTRLTLVRHGQAHCNVAGIVGGARGCTGLTDLGRRQVTALAERLHTATHADPITAAYTSPLRRTLETSDIITRTLGLPVEIENDLREPDYGDADGRAWAEVVTDFGAIPAQHPYDPIAPGAEPWAAFVDRARRTLASLVERHAGSHVLVIAHGETVSAAAHLFLDLPVDTRATASFAVDQASVTTWEQQPLSWTRPQAGWRWTLLRHNDTAHLHTV